MRVDKENKKSMGRGGIRKVRRFQGIIVGKWLHDFGAYLWSWGGRLCKG